MNYIRNLFIGRIRRRIRFSRISHLKCSALNGKVTYLLAEEEDVVKQARMNGC